jgi:hypothetical protein
METIEGTAVYPPSVLQHVNGLVIPGGQEAYTSSYKCGRRCTYVPLGRLSPQPVTLAGYTFHGHHFMTGGGALTGPRVVLQQSTDSSPTQQVSVHPLTLFKGHHVMTGTCRSADCAQVDASCRAGVGVGVC